MVPTGPSRATSPSRASPSRSPWSWSSTASVRTPTAARAPASPPRPRSPPRPTASTSTCRWTAAAWSSATRSPSSSRSRPCSAPPDLHDLRRGLRAAARGPRGVVRAITDGSRPPSRSAHDAADGGGRSGAGPWLRTGARILLGGVFLVAGVLKVPDPAAAVRAVRAYQLLPEPMVAPVAFGLPVVEIAVGLALLLGVFVRTAAVAAAVLLVVFLVGVGSAWARGLQIDCGCFGTGGEVAAGKTAYPLEVFRDGALLLAALLLARRPASRLALGGRPAVDPVAPEEYSRAR